MSFKTLGEVCDKGDAEVQTGPFGSQLHQSDYVDDGVPVVMPKDITNGRIDEESVARVSEHKAQSLPRHFLRPKDIVMPRRGEINKRALITDDQVGYLCGTGCVRIRLFNGSLDPVFLYYYLDQPRVIQWIEQRAVGSTMLNLNTGIIKDLPLPAIEFATQRRIASILSSYDELIENNRKRINLLERAARLLYTEWFVRLRFPGHEGGKVKATELGRIPTLWQVTPLSEVCSKIGSGATPRGGEASYKEEGITLVRSQNVYDFNFTMDGLAYIDEEQAAELDGVTVKEKDILLNITGASVGRCCAMPLRLLPARVNQHVMIVRVDPAKITAAYVLCALNNPVRKAQLLSLAQGKGATREALTKTTMEQFKIVLPDERTLKAFDAMVEPMFKQREVLDAQNAALTRARDLLLPRLMSGKVRV